MGATPSQPTEEDIARHEAIREEFANWNMEVMHTSLCMLFVCTNTSTFLVLRVQV